MDAADGVCCFHFYLQCDQPKVGWLVNLLQCRISLVGDVPTEVPAPRNVIKSINYH